MIIGVCGLIASGKSSIADHLATNYGFEKISFADPLKDSLHVLFNWDRQQLEGDTKESRAWREQVDEALSKEFGREITPRSMMQEYGTEVMRNNLHYDIWCIIIKLRMLQHREKHYVIPDVRFPNEKEVIKSVGGELWQVRRGKRPSWWFDAIKTNEGTMNYMRGYEGVHESEYRWVDFDSAFDRILKNKGTLDELYEQIDKCMTTMDV